MTFRYDLCKSKNEPQQSEFETYMSAPSSITSANNAYPIANQRSFGRIIRDFSSIGSALQTGNVASAQSALSAFQQNLQNNPQTSASQPFGANTKANTDFQNLASALKSGDLSTAQKAFSSLQADLKSAQPAMKSHGGHHHHGSGGGSAGALINSLTSDSTTASTSSTTSTASTSSTNSASASSTNDSANNNSSGTNDGSLLNVTA